MHVLKNVATLESIRLNPSLPRIAVIAENKADKNASRIYIALVYYGTANTSISSYDGIALEDRNGEDDG